MKKKEVILMFSGGRDSFLSACYLIEDGFRVCMATFENGAGLQTYNAAHGARRIIETYGQEKADPSVFGRQFSTCKSPYSNGSCRGSMK